MIPLANFDACFLRVIDFLTAPWTVVQRGDMTKVETVFDFADQKAWNYDRFGRFLQRTTAKRRREPGSYR